MSNDVERQLRDMKWPTPPAALRDRVVADAGRTVGGAGWPERLWFSRAFRWSVAAAMLAMLVVNLRPGAIVAGARPSAASAVAEMQAIQAIVVDAGLPADAAATIARRATVARAAAPRPTGLTAVMQVLESAGER